MDELTARPYVFGGRWMARCPHPACVNVEWSGPGPVTGRLGGLHHDAFTCLRCGLHCAVEWPVDAAVIWRLLQQRPCWETRNWDLGEPTSNLLAENIAHGLINPDELDPGLWMLNGQIVGPAAELIPAPQHDLLAIGGR